jgi:hypothetical protein
MFEFFSLSRAFDKRLIFRRVSADPAGWDWDWDWDDVADDEAMTTAPPPPPLIPMATPPLLFARERLFVMAPMESNPVPDPKISLLDVLDRGMGGGWGDIGLFVIGSEICCTDNDDDDDDDPMGLMPPPPTMRISSTSSRYDFGARLASVMIIDVDVGVVVVGRPFFPVLLFRQRLSFFGPTFFLVPPFSKFPVHPPRPPAAPPTAPAKLEKTN